MRLWSSRDKADLERGNASGRHESKGRLWRHYWRKKQYKDEFMKIDGSYEMRNHSRATLKLRNNLILRRYRTYSSLLSINL